MKSNLDYNMFNRAFSQWHAFLSSILSWCQAFTTSFRIILIGSFPASANCSALSIMFWKYSKTNCQQLSSHLFTRNLIPLSLLGISLIQNTKRNYISSWCFESPEKNTLRSFDVAIAGKFSAATHDATRHQNKSKESFFNYNIEDLGQFWPISSIAKYIILGKIISWHI